MGMDSSDYRLVQDIKSANQEMLGELKQISRQQERALENDARMMDAFARVVRALEGLQEEMSGLRKDITPPLDKPKTKMPAIKTGR
jgi:hypothetical protein